MMMTICLILWMPPLIEVPGTPECVPLRGRGVWAAASTALPSIATAIIVTAQAPTCRRDPDRPMYLCPSSIVVVGKGGRCGVAVAPCMSGRGGGGNTTRSRDRFRHPVEYACRADPRRAVCRPGQPGEGVRGTGPLVAALRATMNQPTQTYGRWGVGLSVAAADAGGVGRGGSR